MQDRRGHGDEGASAVEFALLLPILVVLVFGILFGGILLNQQLSVTQAAREGARFAATLPVEDSEPGADWFDRVRDRAVRGSAGSITASDTLCIWYLTEAGDIETDSANAGLGCPPDAPGELPGDDAGDRVVVYAEQPATFNLVMYAFDTTLRSRAVARHEGGIPAGT